MTAPMTKEELLDKIEIVIGNENPDVSSQAVQTPSDSGRILKFDKRRKVVRKTAAYNPVTWKPLYDAIIMELIMFGSKKKVIAEKYKVTPQTVSNIINCEEGRVKIRAAQERVRETMLRTIPQRMNDIAEKAVDRMQEFINDDTLYEKSPFAVIDRGMRFMQGTKLLADKDHVAAKPDSAVNLSEKAMDRLSHALERINESINPPPEQKQIGA